MEEKKLENDIIIKTSLMGFDKKSVMDFIEQLEQEKEEYKKQYEAASRDLKDAKAEIEALRAQNRAQNKELELSEDLSDSIEIEPTEIVERAKMYDPFSDSPKKPLIKARKAPKKVHVRINNQDK